jgi:hypothetical protein
MSPAERMRRMRQRRKQAGLKPVVNWLPKDGMQSTYSFHRVLDARSLAMHVMVAQKIERQPGLLDIPRRNLARWSQQRAGEVPMCLKEWQEIMVQPWPCIAGLITEQSERATRLRQSSPFTGVLTPAERKRIYDAFRA